MAETATAVQLESQSSVPSDAWAQALKLTCQLTVDMPLPEFKVADILRLKPNSVVNSHWRLGSDVPARVNGKLIAHGEFEVVGNHLALRLTELI